MLDRCIFCIFKLVKMFAVIKSGGKQYKVALGSILKLERIEQKKNSDVLFKVLMINNRSSYELETPFLKKC